MRTFVLKYSNSSWSNLCKDLFVFSSSEPSVLSAHNERGIFNLDSKGPHMAWLIVQSVESMRTFSSSEGHSS